MTKLLRNTPEEGCAWARVVVMSVFIDPFKYGSMTLSKAVDVVVGDGAGEDEVLLEGAKDFGQVGLG
jgi:hypothetical protein